MEHDGALQPHGRGGGGHDDKVGRGLHGRAKQPTDGHGDEHAELEGENAGDRQAFADEEPRAGEGSGDEARDRESGGEAGVPLALREGRVEEDGVAGLRRGQDLETHDDDRVGRARA